MLKQTGIDLKSVMRDMMEECFRINFKTIFISTFPIRPGMDWPWLSLSFREPGPGPALLGQYGATNGAFPLHGTARYGMVRFTFGGFSTGYCTWYLILF